MSNARFYFNICLVGVPFLTVCIMVAVKQWKHTRFVNNKLDELGDRARTCKQEEVESVLLEVIDLARSCSSPYQNIKVTGLIQYLMGREWRPRK